MACLGSWHVSCLFESQVILSVLTTDAGETAHHVTLPSWLDWQADPIHSA